MSGTSRERAGVIVVRVWTETGPGAPQGLRARVTASSDLATGSRTVSAASGVEGALAAVREWLERFASGKSKW